MGYSIRLLKIKCLKESDESSDADEPFVLVTAIDLAWPPPLTVPPLPNVPPPPVTFRYGEWENFDKGEELTLIGEQPFWEDPLQRELTNPDDVCFVVTVLEHDHGDLDAYRGTVEAAASDQGGQIAQRHSKRDRSAEPAYSGRPCRYRRIALGQLRH